MRDQVVWIYALMDPRPAFEGQEPTDERGRIRYVGKSYRPFHRLTEHLACDGSNPYRDNWIRKLRRLSLEPILVLLEPCDAESWKPREKWWEAYFRDLAEPLTNIAECGNGGIPEYAAETRRKMSDSARRRCTEEWREKISQAKIEWGRERNPLTVSGITKSVAEWAREAGISWATLDARLKKGWDPQEAVSTGPAPLHGRPCSDEARAKMSAAGKGRQVSDETREKMGAASRARWANGTYTPEVIEKMRQGQIARGGRPHTDATREKCRQLSYERALAKGGITIGGMTKTIGQWAAEIGISPGSLRDRLANGWDPVQAVTTGPLDRPLRPANGWAGRTHSEDSRSKMSAAKKSAREAQGLPLSIKVACALCGARLSRPPTQQKANKGGNYFCSRAHSNRFHHARRKAAAAGDPCLPLEP